MLYEHKKHSGDIPIVGVNTFLSKEGSPFEVPNELVRATNDDKDRQISNVHAFQNHNHDAAVESLAALQRAAVRGKNVFAQLMETSKVASLGQMSRALYEVGGQYRRNM